MKKITAAIFLCWTLTGVYAQDFGSAGFLSITPDARSAAMGGVGVALSPGAYAIYHNASRSVFSDKRGEIAYGYTPWMRDFTDDIALHSAAGYYRLGDEHAVSAAFRYFTNTVVPVMDNNGNITGNIRPKEMALEIAYSRKILPSLAVSLTARYVSSDMGTFDGASRGVAAAFDLGLSYDRSLTWFSGARWAAGLQLSNIGSKIKYMDEKYDLPGNLKLGGTLVLPFSENHGLECAIDLGIQVIPSGISDAAVEMGVEYFFLQHGFLRGGYRHVDRNSGAENFTSVGAGFFAGVFKCDFSYWITDPDSVFRNTLSLTACLAF